MGYRDIGLSKLKFEIKISQTGLDSTKFMLDELDIRKEKNKKQANKEMKICKMQNYKISLDMRW